MNEADINPTNAPLYHIESVQDFLKVPEDRIDDCLKEFAMFLQTARGMKVVLSEIDKEMHGEITTGWEFPRFTWIDDNEKKATVILQTGDEEELIEVGK